MKSEKSEAQKQREQIEDWVTRATIGGDEVNVLI